MATQNPQASRREPTRRVQDLPGCIKYILLFFLILLLLAEIYSGEFRRFPDWTFIVWSIFLIKLILIGVLIWLIRVQRTLNCKITDPQSGVCTTEEIDTVAGIQFIRVKGTASGTVFGHYTLAMSGPYPYTVMYPPGGGTVPVNNAELGKIDTTALDNGDYTITLTVFPIGAGAPKTCTVNFTLLKIAVYITRAAGVPAVPNFFEQDAEFVQGMHIVSIGGSIHLDGSAYVYTCVDRKIERYEIRYARIANPGPGPAQPLTDAAIPGDWPAGNQVHTPVVYDPSKYWPWTKVGPAPMNLINDWITQHFGAPSPGGTDYPCLAPTSWNSFAVIPDAAHQGGRYALLLIVTDTQAHRYYDMQRIWLDNWPVRCDIVKFQKPGETPGTWIDIPACTDILMSWQKLRIIGLAWDALIDSDWAATAPNDNFENYGLSYLKQFSLVPADSIPITPTGDHPLLSSTRRVPDTLTPLPGPMAEVVNADLLVEWDLTTLDAGALTGEDTCETAPDVGNKLYRNCACTYSLSLGVNDKTVEEGSSYIHHPSLTIPIKVINDL